MRFIDLLVLYIKQNYKPSTEFIIISQSVKVSSQQNTIVVSETGGQSAQLPDLQNSSRVQIFTQSSKDELAHIEILKMESFLANRFNVEVTNEAGKAVGKIASILSIDRPIQLGSNGIVYQYIQNYEIVWFKSHIINKEIL
jgi:hypothetical protein